MSVENYQEGILDVCQFLITDLRDLLEKEGRFKFKVERYWTVLRGAINSFNRQVSEEDSKWYGRVMYVLSKSLHNEYRYLRFSKMTQADCVICIIHRLIEYSETHGTDFRFSEEQEKIKTIIDALWENIRHYSKTKKLPKIKSSIDNMIENSVYGTLSLDEFDITETDKPRQKENTLTGNSKRYFESSGKTNEILL